VPRFFVSGAEDNPADRRSARAMANAADLRRIAQSLPGTTEAPHFDRAAFKVDRIYATLAADSLSANFKFTPDEQEFKCQLAPDVFRPIDNGWGRQGWTTAVLAAASESDLRAALEMAYAHATGKRKR
jgi:hypothetical protein